MKLYCSNCGDARVHVFVRTERDDKGNEWHIYRCRRCERERWYAVK